MTNIHQRRLKKPSNDTKQECWLDYSIEAMKPVNKEVSEVLFEIAATMGHDLKTELRNKNVAVDTHVIGSLANNTHINYKETIDILIIYHSNKHTESNIIEVASKDDLVLLRDYTKRYLRFKFPEALIDDSQPLALEISINSLPCNFCYYFGNVNVRTNTAFGNLLKNTQIQLFNFKSYGFNESNPFEIIDAINQKDENTNGNTKTLIRLLKNLKEDAFNPVTLTGYQLVSIIYSMEDYTLAKPNGQLLFLLLELSLFLKKIKENPYTARSLKSPDNFQLINSQNESSFMYGVNQLKAEIDSFIKHLILEIDLYTDIYGVTINH